MEEVVGFLKAGRYTKMVVCTESARMLLRDKGRGFLTSINLLVYAVLQYSLLNVSTCWQFHSLFYTSCQRKIFPTEGPYLQLHFLYTLVLPYSKYLLDAKLYHNIYGQIRAACPSSLPGRSAEINRVPTVLVEIQESD